MENDYITINESKQKCDICKMIIQPERLSEKTTDYMNVYEDCLSKQIPINMKNIFCGCDSLNTANKMKAVSETRRGFAA